MARKFSEVRPAGAKRRRASAESARRESVRMLLEMGSDFGIKAPP